MKRSLRKLWRRLSRARTVVAMPHARRHALARPLMHEHPEIAAPLAIRPRPAAFENAAGLGVDLSLFIGPLATALQQLLDAIPAALGVFDRDGVYLAANTAYAAIHGLTPQALVGGNVSDYLPESEAQLSDDLARFDGGIDSIEREVQCHGRCYLVALQPVHDSRGSVQGVASVLVDITARKREEDALERARRHWQFHASHDHLTGLPNRRRIDEVLLAEVGRCARAGVPLSVLMIDVDYFKKYNDGVGHQQGDECLRRVALQLQSRMRRHGDLVGRYGGEEFIAILPGTDAEGAVLVAQGVLDDMRELAIEHPASPYCRVTLSIGVATLGEREGPSSRRCDVLLGHADRALYAAKAGGRNTLRTHPPLP
ncbi:GGDEF domain-containing protein [Dyella sp. ASV21]|jgi:diguanylate cyclase (GGDEF)-like protein/PAS domain S-box-containing protein|uniref:GGDEF domain-containing protein n=1 Tax=Dyella sp. ASV21 TaxID=2795114 RepID=UPI0018ED5A22|nr:GGDEF domain-containing protein [Dyella sp. ASV21]